LGFPDEKLGQRRAKEQEAQKSERANKNKEVTVVATANAVVDPDTVMVLRLDTVVTDAAMMGARRAPDIAAFAVLCWNFHGCIG
jgi:hypothetical protein